MNKKIDLGNLKKFTKKNDQKTVPDHIIDNWVNNNNGDSNLNKNKETRFTVVIPTDLHKKIKKHCVEHSLSLKKLMTDILTQHFISK